MIKMQINNKQYEVDGKKKELDIPPMQIDDKRTVVPIRAVAEGFGFTVEWDEETKTVTIYDRKKYFNTVDECAFDWAMHWNAMSIALFKEMCGVIYKNDKGYYWDNIRISNADGKVVAFDTVQAKKGIALIHSHGGGQHWNTKTMSKADFDIAKQFKKPLYMVDSGGYLWVYDPTEDKPKQKLVKEGLPKDVRWMDITKSAELHKEYFSMGYHCLDEYEHGYKADYYNKLHMKGLSYLKEV